MVAPEPPARVKDAVKNWTNRGGLERIPPGGEYSYIDDWGVRVTFTDGNQTKKAFICMADSGCREATDGRNLILLSGGKTSSAVKHLTTRHHLESPKTVKEVATKRKRNADIERLRTSTLYTRNPVRLNLLLETLRIINNNLPLEMVEYDESRLKEALVLRQEVQSTLTTERVNECIIEIYSSTRKEVVAFLKSNLLPYPNLTMVADMWTCKTTSNKFLGLRVYLIDKDWNFKSVLLGTRKFTPAYGDRDGGVQAPFLCWIKRTLEDFELTVDNFYGATSDKGPDVQNLMKNRLHYQWEWCMAHMSHAATRASCGMNSNDSKNPGMSSLIRKMSKVIYEVKHVEVTGDLFKKLCENMTTGKATTLLSYSDARFLSVTKAMRRVLDKWQVIQAWYDERAAKATRENNTPPVFPLAGEYTTLTQVMSILKSLADLKRSCQAEMPTQVENLMMLYRIRLNDLDLEKPIRHYLSTTKKPIWIQPSDLAPLAATTRRLLQEALDKRFFIRYYDETKMATTSYVFEMQQKLHPVFKSPRHNLNAVILKVCQNHGDSGRAACEKRDKVHQLIRDQLRNLIERVAEPRDMRDPTPSSPPVYYNELEEMFAPRSSRPLPQNNNHLHRFLDEELDRWMNDPIEPLRASDNNKPEPVLPFWGGMEREGNYRLLPKVVKVLFAVPMSSCQIERDFSVSGNMVTTQRTSLSQQNIDMCSFLNRNRDFIDLLQCEEIPRGQHKQHTPSCFTFPLDADPDIYTDMDSIMDDMMTNFVSSATLYEEQKEEV